MVSHQLSARACRQEIKAGKRRSLPALLVGAAALLVLLAVAVSYAADLGSSIVVRDAGGEVISRAPLSGSGGFEIEYVHSYYEAPAAEHFVVAGDGSFGLVEVSSPSEAVLDYYEIEGRKEETDGGRMRLLPDELQSFEELPLIGTEKGRRTLVVFGDRLPLYEEGGPRHVTIRVEEDGLFTELRGLLGG